MNQAKPSQWMVTLAPTQAIPGSGPTKRQEVARYREPRQRTHWSWLNLAEAGNPPQPGLSCVVRLVSYWCDCQLEWKWVDFFIHPILWISSTSLRRKRDGAIDVKNINSIQRCYWPIYRNRVRHACLRGKSESTCCSHPRYVDFVIHSSLSTIYQLLFAGYRREPAWASRTVDEESAQPRPNLWKRRDEVKVSVYETPITDLGSKLISLSILCQPFHLTSHDGRCVTSTTYVDIGWADHIDSDTHPGQCHWPGTYVRSLYCTEIIINVPLQSQSTRTTRTTIPSRWDPIEGRSSGIQFFVCLYLRKMYDCFLPSLEP